MPAPGGGISWEIAAAAALAGALTAAAVAGWRAGRSSLDPLALARARRRLLPRRIILVRHGESEGNADMSLYRNKADNLIELTQRGAEQAAAAGARIEKIVGDDRIEMHVSPFERTLETALHISRALGERVKRVHIDPLIREQEFGNLQGDDFKTFREEQARVGRFFYRFPTGESGSDVYGRTKTWWTSCILPVNERPDYEHVDTVVVVTHGLTMRLILMQLFGWSPNTFGAVWNAGNCALHVLVKDETRGKSHAPYVLDEVDGDKVESSIDLICHMKDGTHHKLTLRDYLAIPSPRSHHEEVAIRMLAHQHALDASAIDRIDFFGGRSGYDASVVPQRSARRQACGADGRRGAGEGGLADETLGRARNYSI